MVTLSPTEARVNLSSLLKRAAKGEDIGILHGGKIIGLRPVSVHADDYVLREYGATEKELDRFVKHADQEVARERKTRKTRKYSGNLKADLGD